MANITYNDKTQLLPYNDKKFNAEDANELKRVVNQKADISQIIDGNQSLGAWNAATNTPALTTTPATIGKFYEVSIGGTQSITGTSVTYSSNDKIISNGTSWQYIPFNTSGSINQWTAQAYKLGANVSYLGKDWVSTEVTISTDVPNSSTKWIPRLSALNGLQTLKTINLFNINTAVVGTLGAAGQNATSTTATRSDYIPVYPSTSYTFWDTINPKTAVLAGLNAYYYTVAKVFITGSVNAGTSPANAAYVRFTTARNILANIYLMFIEGAVQPLKFSKYGYSLDYANANYPLIITSDAIADAVKDSTAAIAANLQAVENSVTPKQASFLYIGVNKFNINDPDYRTDTALTPSTGATYVQAGFATSGYVPVIAGTSYIFTTGATAIKSNGLSLASYYDANKVFLSAVTYASGVAVPPTGAAFIRFCIQVASMASLMFIVGTVSPGQYSTFSYEFDATQIRVPSLTGRWNGKNWCALGDSITANNYYATSLSATTGLIQVLNRGEVGSLLRTRADSLVASDLTNIDIVTVLAGTNDYGHGNCAIGSITDGKEVNSIYGNVAYVIDKILTLKPTVRLVFFTPLNRGAFTGEPTPPAANSYGSTIDGIGFAIREKCRLLNIPCYDLFANSGLNQYTFSLYTSDGLHPNSAYGSKMGTLMGEYINRINL